MDTLDRLLVVIRHASAESFGDTDRARRLTDTGRAEARAAGVWLQQRLADLGAPGRPDHALVSSAVRTRETWAALSDAAGWDVTPTFDDNAYSGSTDVVLDLLRGTPAGARVVVYLGHNPTAASLAHHLDDGEGDPDAWTDMTAGFAAGSVAVLAVRCDWADLDAGQGSVLAFRRGSR